MRGFIVIFLIIIQGFSFNLIDIIKQNNVKEFVKILKKGEDGIFYITKEGYNYIHLIAYEGNIRMLYYILNYRNFNDCYIKEKNEAYFIVLKTFLNKTQCKNYISFLPKILRKKAEIVKTKKYYQVVLKYFNKTAAYNILNQLKKHSLTLNMRTKNLNTPIHFMTFNNKIKTYKTVKFLKFYNANFCAKNKLGLTPLDLEKNETIKKYILNIIGKCK